MYKINMDMQITATTIIVIVIIIIIKIIAFHNLEVFVTICYSKKNKEINKIKKNKNIKWTVDICGLIVLLHDWNITIQL